MPQAKYLDLRLVPKKVQKRALIKCKISILPAQVRSTIDSDQLNLLPVGSDRKNYTWKPDCKRDR